MVADAGAFQSLCQQVPVCEIISIPENAHPDLFAGVSNSTYLSQQYNRQRDRHCRRQQLRPGAPERRRGGRMGIHFERLNNIPQSAQSNVKAVPAGSGHAVAWLANGTVVAWEDCSSGQCNTTVIRT